MGSDARRVRMVWVGPAASRAHVSSDVGKGSVTHLTRREGAATDTRRPGPVNAPVTTLPHDIHVVPTRPGVVG